MSWGYKIAILYISFVAIILTGVIASTFQDYHLVRQDYYEAEIAYEDRIQEIENFKALSQKPEMVLQGTQLALAFPEGMQQAMGTVHLYRPSDSDLDKKYPLALVDGGQSLSLAGFKKAIGWPR
jgi:hypothetical protein